MLFARFGSRLAYTVNYWESFKLEEVGYSIDMVIRRIKHWIWGCWRKGTELSMRSWMSVHVYKYHLLTVSLGVKDLIDTGA